MDRIRIETEPVHVKVFTDDHEIEGYVHVKPGGYQARVSDLLNHREIRYIPITNATYRSLHDPEDPSHEAETLIVRIDTIKMVVPEPVREASEESGQEVA